MIIDLILVGLVCLAFGGLVAGLGGSGAVGLVPLIPLLIARSIWRRSIIRDLDELTRTANRVITQAPLDQVYETVDSAIGGRTIRAVNEIQRVYNFARGEAVLRVVFEPVDDQVIVVVFFDHLRYPLYFNVAFWFRFNFLFSIRPRIIAALMVLPGLVDTDVIALSPSITENR
jgi:hypothetical protein